MSWGEMVAWVLGGGTIGGVGLKWVLETYSDRAKERRGERAESIAIMHLTTQVNQLAKRVGELEAQIEKRDDEVAELNKSLDDERRLRRSAEDSLDVEQRARRSLEQRVAELERKSG